LLRDAHHRAGLFYTADRLFQDVDLNHSRKIHFDRLSCNGRRESHRYFEKIIWMTADGGSLEFHVMSARPAV
jgi:hypothetical protein